VDSGSSCNYGSERLVKKITLPTKPHPKLYKLLALRLAKQFDEVNMDQNLLSGLLEGIMDLDGSFGLEHRLGVCE